MKHNRIAYSTLILGFLAYTLPLSLNASQPPFGDNSPTFFCCQPTEELESNRNREENPLIEADLEAEFLVWFQNHVSKIDSLNTKQKTAIGIGKIFSALASVPQAVLGYDFGKQITAKLSIPTSQTIAWGAATFSTTTYTLLCIDFTTQLATLIFTKKTGNEKVLLKDTSSITKLENWPHHLLTSTAVIAGAFSSGPSAYLAHKLLFPIFGHATWLFVGPTLIAEATLDGYSIHTITSSSFNLISSTTKNFFPSLQSTRYKQELYLYDQLTQAESFIKGLSSKQAKNLTNHIKFLASTNESFLDPSQNANPLSFLSNDSLNSIAGRTSSAAHEEQLQNLRSVFRTLTLPKSFFCEDEDTGIPVMPYNKIGRMISKTIGGTIGAIGIFAIRPVAEIATDSLLSSIGIHSPTANKVCGWLATVTATPLAAWAVSKSVDKIYQACASGGHYLINRLKKAPQPPIASKTVILQTGAAAASLIIAATASAPQAKLAIDYFGYSTPLQIAILTCAIASPLAVSFWPIHQRLSDLALSTDKHSYLLQSIERLKNSLPHMTDQTINTIFGMMDSHRYNRI